VELTLSERRVATLAAKGYRNREIAERLLVSVGTVERHLSTVYKKLSVPGREWLVVAPMPAQPLEDFGQGGAVFQAAAVGNLAGP
jgi:DNA-binding NarL/FixJ family response regulator